MLHQAIFSSIDSEYVIWRRNKIDLKGQNQTEFSPISIKPELLLRSEVKSAYFKYEDLSDQAFIRSSKVERLLVVLCLD